MFLLLSLLLLQEPPKAAARFLDATEAAQAIGDDSMEPYFSLLQPAEIFAKTGKVPAANGLAAQREECRQRYREAARDFSADEKAALAAVAETCRRLLQDAYPAFAAAPWSFLKVDGSIEGGMPHTRGPHIVVPERMAAQAAVLRAKGVDPAKTGLGQTLIHEQCHVLQRAHPGLFADLYVNSWGFIRAKGLPGHPWLESVQIVNPDGPDVGWVFPAKDGAATSYWQPLVILKEGVERPSMPRDFVLVGVALDRSGDAFTLRLKDGKPETLALDQIPPWQAAFGHVGENFHPNETFAVLFSRLAMLDHVSPSPKPPKGDFTKLRDWCRKNFAKAPEKK